MKKTLVYNFGMFILKNYFDRDGDPDPTHLKQRIRALLKKYPNTVKKNGPENHKKNDSKLFQIDSTITPDPIKTPESGSNQYIRIWIRPKYTPGPDPQPSGLAIYYVQGGTRG